MEFDVETFAPALVSSMSEGLVVADAGGTIRWWNAGAERIFGYTAGEALGQTLDIIIPDNLRARHWDGYNRTIETGTSKYGPGDLLSVPAIRKDGGRISVEFTIVAFRNTAGSITGIAAVMRDATKQFEEMRALRKQVAQNTAAGRAKGSDPDSPH